MPRAMTMTKKYSFLILVFLTHFFVSAADFLPNGIIPSNIGVQLKSHNENAQNLDRIKDAGFMWVRRGFIWEAVEKQKGVYDFARYDKLIQDCEARGLSIVGCIAFSNVLYGHAKDEPGRTAYANYAAALAERYKDKNIVWEIWNEPNTMTFWGKHGGVGNSPQYAEEYTNLVSTVVPAMKQAAPDCYILAGSVSNMWSASYNWMSYCFSNEQMLDIAWDAWSVHPYGLKSPEDYLEAYSISRNLMVAAGGDDKKRPWINSERGFTLTESGSEEMQAALLIRQYLVDMLEDVPLTIWYEWSGDEGFSLYKGGSVGSALGAFSVFMSELSGYRFDKRIYVERARDFVLQFINAEGQTKWVAWTAPEPNQKQNTIVPHAVDIAVGEQHSSVETINIFGQKNETETNHGIISPVLTGSPLYIKADNNASIRSVVPQQLIVPAENGVQINVDKISILKIYRPDGMLYQQQSIDAGASFIPLCCGFYIINIDNIISKKIIVK